MLSLSLATAAYAGDSKLTVADALLALQISVSEDEPTEAQIARLDLNNDGVITVADVLMILRIAVGLEPLETPPLPGIVCLEPLTPEADLRLRENYAVFRADRLGGLTAEDLMVMYYFGTFGGREVAVIFPKNGIMTMDMQYIHLAGYTIPLGSGSLELMVHDNGTFVPIEDAYEQGLINAEDIGIIAGGVTDGVTCG
jgi:Ca2+-binding EF-hand superfamily protein